MPLLSDLRWTDTLKWLKDLGQRVQVVQYAEAVLAFAIVGALIFSVLGSRWYLVVVVVLIAVILLILQQLAKLKPETSRIPALMLLWGCVLSVMVMIALATSVFFVHWPIQLANWTGLEHDPDKEQTSFLETMTLYNIDHHECGELDLQYSRRLAQECIVRDLVQTCTVIKNRNPNCFRDGEPIVAIADAKDELTTTVAPAHAPTIQIRSASGQEKCKSKIVSSLAKDKTVLGFDTSHHDTIDWDAMKKLGYVFVFIKATEGTSRLDPAFKTNWDQAGQHGFVRGAYHYFRSGNGNAEANNFLNVFVSSDGRSV
jgi:hypothetical protein